VRRELEEWFAAYPVPEQANLAGRFRDRRREQHLPAWWELYLYRLFNRLGWKGDVHPTLPASSARVDFYVRHEQGFFVEAVTAFSGILDEDRNAAREAQVLAAIDELRSQTYSIGIDFDRVGTQTPSLRKITAAVDGWLNRLNPDTVASEVARGAPYPSLTLEPEGWRIVFEAFPIAPEYRHEPPGRLVGVGPVLVGPVDDVEKIRNAVKGKRSKYPQLEKPLVVAVLSMSAFAGLRDFAQALVGRHAVECTIPQRKPARWVRLRDGAWMTQRGPSQRISAALTVADLAPSGISRVTGLVAESMGAYPAKGRAPASRGANPR
jgi:hypothetical protein